MKDRLNKLGTRSGYIGTLLCLSTAVIGLFANKLLGFRTSTVFLVGIAVLAFACWAKLEAASRDDRQP